MRLKKTLLIIGLFSLLNASDYDVVDIGDELKGKESRRDAPFKSIVSIGTQQDYWKPGLDQGLIEYTTEGLNVGYIKYKAQLHDMDIFELIYLKSFNGSENQKELIKEYKKDSSFNSYVDSLEMSVNLFKLADYYFQTNLLTGLNYRYKKTNFIGKGSLLNNTLYWYGDSRGNINEDFMPIEKGTTVTFKTKFISHKLMYDFKHKKNELYYSIGAFSLDWSKPTFTGTYLRNGEIPVTFGANYENQGVSLKATKESNFFNINAYIDYGVNGEMKLTKEITEDVNLLLGGITADIKIYDIYQDKDMNIDLLIGGSIEYSKLDRDNKDIDAELVSGINAQIRATF